MTSREESLCPQCRSRVFLSDDQCMNCGARLDEGRLAGAPAAPGTAPAQPTISYSSSQPTVGYSTAPKWRPTDAPLGGGFLAGISRAWTFLGQSLGMAFKDKDLILPSVFSILVNAVIVGGIIGIMWATGLWQAWDSERQTLVLHIAIAVISVCAAFVTFLVCYFFTGMTVNLVDVHLTGRDATLREAFADARKNFMAIMWLATLSALIAAVSSAARSRRRYGLGDLAADAIDKVWQVAAYLMLPIIILEDVPLSQASKRAWKLHEGGALGVIVGEIGVTVLTNAIGFVGFLIGAGLAAGSYVLSPALLPYGIGVGVLIFASVIAFTMYVRTAYYTCLYLWAAATETVGAVAPAPAPLVAAMAS